MRSWISSTVKLEIGALAQDKSPYLVVVFFSSRDRFGGVSWGGPTIHDTIVDCACAGCPRQGVGGFGSCGRRENLLNHFDSVDNETCLNDLVFCMLEDWGECLENGRDFVAAKGEKIAAPEQNKTRGFDLLIKEDCAGLLAAGSRMPLLFFFFCSARSHESGGSSPGVSWS